MCATDNVAIYISLFIGMRIWEVLMTALLFYLLLLSSIASACLLIQVNLLRTEDYNNSQYDVS